MSTAVVIDASVALARVRREPGWQDIDRMIRAWRTTGFVLWVPNHFWLEISNALVRGHRLSAAAAFEAVHRLDELGLETVEMDRPLLLLALDLADRHALTMYDAAYLAVAESVGGLLFTADRQLAAAAGSRGLLPSGLSDHRLSETHGEYHVAQRSTWPDYSGASAYLAKLRSEASRSA
jgi:predicted nucleic acid-binding protein